MKKFTLLFVVLLITAGGYAINWKDASGTTTSDSSNPSYVDPCQVPGSVLFTNISYGSGTINVNYTATSTLDVGSTYNGGYFVVAVAAENAGKYEVTLSLATQTTNPNERGANVELFNTEAECSSAAVNSDLTQYSVNNGTWADYKTLKWVIDMPAGITQYLRIRAVKASGSWVWNLNGVTFSLASKYVNLQSDITTATNYYNQVKDYAKMSAQSLLDFQAALTIASGYEDGLTDEEYDAAIAAFETALDALKAEVNKPFILPCMLDLPAYYLTNNTSFTTSSMGSAERNKYTIYKVNASKGGTYIPIVSAATNTVQTSSPRLNLALSNDIEELTTNFVVDEANSQLIATNGWSGYSSYTFPEVDLLTGTDYYVRLTNLSGEMWAVGVNQVKFDFDDTPTNIKTTESSFITIYPNPATDYISVSVGGLVTITNLVGAVQKRLNVKDGEQVHIGSLATGTYLISILSNGAVETIKLIKK